MSDAPPLVATLQRGRERIHRGCHLGADVHAVPPRAAVTLDALVDDPLWLADVLAGVGEEVGTSRSDVQASLFLEAYAWTLLLPLAGSLVVERRVPLLQTGGAAVVLCGGLWPDGLVLSGVRFAALADDRDAGHADAVTVTDDNALAAVLRDQIVEHLRHPIGALTAHSGRPQRALWRTVADRLAAAALFAAEAVGDLERGSAVATAVLSGPPPLVGRPDYRVIAGPEAPIRIHSRQGCCLWWRTRAASCCISCPRSRPVT